MKIRKQYVVILFYYILLIAAPAQAQIPVSNFIEKISTSAQLTTTGKALVNIKEQLTQLAEGLRSLGVGGPTIAMFQKNLKGINQKIKKLSSLSSANIISSLTGNINIQKSVTDSLKDITSKQNILSGQLVSQVESSLNISKNISKATGDVQKTITQGLNKEINSGISSFSSSFKDNFNKNLTVEEEEEEEEIALKDAQEDVQYIFESIKAESAQLTTELNDSLDEALNILNLGADLNNKQLQALKNALQEWQIPNNQQQKEALEQRLSALMQREQNASDWGARIIESAKNRYNQEYQDKIKEGINSYEKVVQAYLSGKAEQQEVIAAGENLKREISQIDVIPDATVIANYTKELDSIKAEIEVLAQDIEQLTSHKKNKI